MKKAFRRVIGIALILYGFFALLTPFTPGSWLIFVGAELIGLELVFARRVADFLRAQKEWLIAAACFVAPFVAGAIGGFFTTPAIDTWYAFLTKPEWTPPSWVFGPVWTTLYFLMGLAAFLVWRAKKEGREFAVNIFFVHLVLNALWSVVFFGLRMPLYGLTIIVMLWLMIVWLVVLFYPQSRAAAWLLVPYLFWVTYATTLNVGIVMLN